MKHLQNLCFECFETCTAPVSLWASSTSLLLAHLLPFAAHYCHCLLLPSTVCRNFYLDSRYKQYRDLLIKTFLCGATSGRQLHLCSVVSLLLHPKRNEKGSRL